MLSLVSGSRTLSVRGPSKRNARKANIKSDLMDA